MAPTLAYDPVPDWLRETRLSEKRADGKPWTQDDLITAMQAEIGWAPHRPNYSRYENGRSKPEDTLPRFIEFWARRGKPGPDYTPPPPTETPADPLASALQALATELKAMRQERESVEARLRALESELQSLRAPQGGGASGGQYAPPVEAGSGR